MATDIRLDESLVERQEVSFPKTDRIDTEPFYKNVITIENVLRHANEDKQFNTSTHLPKDHYLLNRSPIKPSFNTRIDVNDQNSIDGYIFNLIEIVEEIGYNPKLPFLHSAQNSHHNALSNLIIKLGGADGPLVNTRRSHIDKQYFQTWYRKKYPRSASMIRCHFLIKKTTQKSDDDHQSNIHIHPSLITHLTSKQMEDKRFQNQVLRMYGFDDADTISTVSSRRSSIDEKNSTPSGQSTPVVLETIDNSKPKQQITIREYYPRKDIPSLTVNRSLSPSSSQQTIDDIDYEQFIQNYPEVYNDPELYNDVNPELYNDVNPELYNDANPELYNDVNPELYHDPNLEIITRPNPEQVTYQQNVSVRYLVPPTPPPPGPLIIREIVPPRAPTPPPFIIKQQDPSPPTPPPLILREAPPIPPPHQETEIIDKILPPEPLPPPRVIIEQRPPLPPKPQSIIIEKWLPYKSPPPREVIYEYVTETPLISEFQPGEVTTERQRRHSADLHCKSSARLPIPVHIERQNSSNHLATQQSSVFDQFARSTQQQLKTLQAHQQWIANQHQRHMNMFRQMPLQLTTPALIVHHPPVTKIATAYAERKEVLYQPTLMCPAFI